MVESYRNEAEHFNLQCWALTAESFFDTAEWIWLYRPLRLHRRLRVHLLRIGGLHCPAMSETKKPQYNVCLELRERGASRRWDS